MSELRAPDPTLTALGQSRDVVIQHGTLPPTAHRIADIEAGESVRDYVTGCGLRSLAAQQAQHARWFAVPCRECFPDAPPPGFSEDRRTGDWGLGPGPDRGLAWQVQP